MHIFLSAYFVPSVIEIPKDFKQSLTHKNLPLMNNRNFLVNIFAQSQNSQYCQSKCPSLFSLPELESSKIKVKLRLSDSVSVCSISLFLYAFHVCWCILFSIIIP